MPTWPRGGTLHEALTRVVDEMGEAGLRTFFDEVSANGPGTARVSQIMGLPYLCDLSLPNSCEIFWIVAQDCHWIPTNFRKFTTLNATI